MKTQKSAYGLPIATAEMVSISNTAYEKTPVSLRKSLFLPNSGVVVGRDGENKKYSKFTPVSR